MIVIYEGEQHLAAKYASLGIKHKSLGINIVLICISIREVCISRIIIVLRKNTYVSRRLDRGLVLRGGGRRALALILS